MTSGAPRPSGVGLLTRTILQIEGVLSVASIPQVTRALQRVPGVLLAEVNSESARATVAHDDAVTTASLLAAAAGVGVRAAIVVSPVAAAATAGGVAVQPQLVWNRYLPLVAAAAFGLLAVTDLLVPNVAGKHWVPLALVSALWLGFLAKSIVRRPGA